MAVSGRVRTVSVRVTAEVSDLEKKLRSVQKTLKKTGQQFKDVGMGLTKSITVPVLAAGTGLFALVKSTANAGDEIQKMALRTGFTTEALSELKFAAELSGASIGTVEKGVKRMQKTLFDAEKGLSTSNDALAALNLRFEDLNKLSPEDQFNTLSSAIASIENPSRRAALAQEIFGRAGTELLPMLSAGADGIAAMRKEARDMGIVFDQETADASAKLNDDLARLKGSVTGVFQEVATSLIPVLVDDLIPAIQNNVIPIIRSFAEKIGEIFNWFKSLNPETQKMIGISIALAAALGPVLIVIGKLIGVVGALSKALLFLAANPFGLILVGIAALVAAIIFLWKTNETFRDIVIAVWDAIKIAAVFVFGYIKDFIMLVFNGLKEFWDKWGATITRTFKDYLEIVKIVYSTVFKFIFEFIKIIFNQIKTFWDNWGGLITTLFKMTLENLKLAFKLAWGVIKNVVETAIKLISDIISLVLNIIKGDWESAWEDIKNIGKTVWDFIIKQVELFSDFFIGIFTNIKDNILSILKGVLNGVVGTVKNVIDSVASALDKINIFNRTKPETKVFTTIHETINRVSNVVSDVVGKIIPHAEGGVFTQPTLLGNHLFAEAGPEALVPLDKLSSMMKDGGNVFNININANDEVGGRAAARGFTEEMTRRGWRPQGVL